VLSLAAIAAGAQRVHLFKHIVTREVAYESLSFQMRAQLHEQFAQFLEKQDAERYLPLLAYNYGESSNKAKQREYLRKAGDAAQAVCSHGAAVDHFSRLLPLVDNPGERFELHQRLVEAYFHLANFPAVKTSIDELLRLAQTPAARAAAKAELGRMASQVEADYSRASRVPGEALELARADDDRSILSRVLYALGDASWRLGELEKSRDYLEESLALARAMNDVPRILFALNRLGTVCNRNPDDAQSFQETANGPWPRSTISET
jgi:tetratricopeptide (TPR) repeat protein